MKEIEIRFKVWVSEDYTESRLTKNNILRKIGRLQEEILDDHDETIHDIEVYDANGEKQKVCFPIETI